MIAPQGSMDLTKLGRALKSVLEGGDGGGLILEGRERIMLILMDGVGWRMAEGEQGCVKWNSVFPTVTVTALTSLLTASAPGEHGVLGWRIYDWGEGRILNLLPYFLKGVSPREDAEDFLGRLGGYLREVSVAAVIPNTVREEGILRSLLGEKASFLSYVSPWDLWEVVRATSHLRSQFTLVYIPYVDSLAHRYGPGSPEVGRAWEWISQGLRALVSGMPREYRVVVTADHGQIQVSSHVQLPRGGLRKFGLDVPPFGEPRSLLFVSRRDPTPLFLGRNVEVLRREELRRVAGGDEVPDYAVLPRDPEAFHYWEDGESEFRGLHGGLSKGEVEIPLCIY